MKLSIAWNYWNNFDDVLLASEIVKLSNKKTNTFNDIKLLSQSGYHLPPNDRQKFYLDKYKFIEVDKQLEALKINPKYMGVYRVLNGLKSAYDFGLKNKSDYTLVTNGDAFILDLCKLKDCLNRKEVKSSCLSARVGPVTGLYNTFGSHVPFMDDHFVILNIENCKKFRVFDKWSPKSYNSHFTKFGGIHYLLYSLFNEIVPHNKFYIYTYMEDCLNHFGEYCGYSLLPWQYQPSLGFLHANCEQEQNLHELRSEMLKLFGFNQFPEVNKYCSSIKNKNKILINHQKKFVFYHQPLILRLKIQFLHLAKNLLNIFRKKISQRPFLKKVNSYYFKDRHLNNNKYYKLYSHIYPTGLAQRRKK